MSARIEAELVNKFSKYIKTVRNRVVEVEFGWFQVNPMQSYRLRIDEKGFNEAQKHVRSKKLLNIKFEQFIELITSVFANDATEISSFVLHSTFNCLFDQNSNGTIEQDEFDSLLVLLHGVNPHKQSLLYENLRHLVGHRSNHISFKEFHDFVKCGSLRELLMTSEYQSTCIASHDALIGLNKALAIEGVPFEITSDIISTGRTQTNLFEQFDYIQTSADLVLFLCTDQARSSSDQSIP